MENSGVSTNNSMQRLYGNDAVFLKNNPFYVIFEMAKNREFLPNFLRYLMAQGINESRVVCENKYGFLPVVMTTKDGRDGAKVRVEYGFFFECLSEYMEKNYRDYNEEVFQYLIRNNYYGLYFTAKIIDVFALTFECFYVYRNAKKDPLLFLTETVKNNFSGIESKRKMLYITENFIASLLGEDILKVIRNYYNDIVGYEEHQKNLVSEKKEAYIAKKSKKESQNS